METLRLIAAALLAAGCTGSTSDEPRPVPSDEVLCQVWAGNGVAPGTNAMRGIPGYGSLSTDVIAAWGEPTSRKGDVWTYEWSTAGRESTVVLTFEKRELCYGGGKKQDGLWVSKIEADGIASKMCWNYERRQDEPTCDGCLDQGEVSECR